MDKFKVIMCGGRDYNDYEFLSDVVSRLLSARNKDEVEIVS